MATIRELWDELNNEGKGYSLGSVDEGPEEILGTLGYTDIMQGDPGYWVGTITFTTGLTYITILADSNGPWAVDVHPGEPVELNDAVVYWAP